MSTYTLTITRKQAEAISRACEIVSRLGMGQFKDALEELPLREYLPPGWHDTMMDVARLLAPHLKSTSYGIRHADVSESSRILWDTYQVMRRQMAWEDAVAKGIVPSMDAPRRWPKMMSVWYDDPAHTSTEPLPTIQRIAAKEGT